MLKIKKPVLQVALDFIDMEEALRVAQEVARGGVDWLECGTPLIKAEGMRAIRLLRETFPNIPIVADLKTIDVGALEAKLAFSAGANIITVLALADNKTIIDAVNVARSFGGYVMADLMNHPQPVSRAKELEKMGVDIVLMHIGIDQQASSKFPLDQIPLIRKEIKSYLAVAGGLNDKTAPIAIKHGADIIIVGRYITRADNPTEATKKVKEAITKSLFT